MTMLIQSLVTKKRQNIIFLYMYIYIFFLTLHFFFRFLLFLTLFSISVNILNLMVLIKDFRIKQMVKSIKPSIFNWISLFGSNKLLNIYKKNKNILKMKKISSINFLIWFDQFIWIHRSTNLSFSSYRYLELFQFKKKLIDKNLFQCLQIRWVGDEKANGKIRK